VLVHTFPGNIVCTFIRMQVPTVTLPTSEHWFPVFAARRVCTCLERKVHTCRIRLWSVKPQAADRALQKFLR
jgi:hypothetical protein